MLVAVAEGYTEFYEQGHLDYVFSNLGRFDSVEEWQEYLAKEPIAYFTNDKDWSLEGNLIKYKEGEEEYTATMQINIGEDILLHSVEASQSMFFNVLAEGRLELIYVD